MDMGSSIRDVLEDGGEVTVEPSMKVKVYERRGLKQDPVVDAIEGGGWKDGKTGIEQGVD